jgi:hypothetical protein
MSTMGSVGVEPEEVVEAFLGGVDVVQDALGTGILHVRVSSSAARWDFAMYLASKDGYEDAVLPTGALAGLPEDALDCAAGLYLGDPTL